MPKGKRVANNTSLPSTEERKNKLAKLDEKVELATGTASKKLIAAKTTINAAKSNILASPSTLPSPSVNQIASSKVGTNKKRNKPTPGRESKRVKFTDILTSAATLVKHKKATEKKKFALRKRSNSVLADSNSQNSKPKSAASTSVGTKRKLKVKKKRAITNVATSNDVNNSASNAIVNAKPIERVLTRTPLENAVANAAIRMNISDEELRVSAGSANSHVNIYRHFSQPLYSFSTDLPKVKTISSGEEKKSSESSSPRGNNGSTPSGSGQSAKSKPETTTGGTNSTNNGDDDPEKKKNNDKDNAPNSSNASTSTSSSDGIKRKRKLTEENSAKIANENVASTSAGISAQSAEDEQDKDEEDKDSKKKKNRCAECRKKVGLTGFQCRCGGLYCAVHRYSDKHNCTFNYREHGAQEIRRNNPVVVGEKIQKI